MRLFIFAIGGTGSRVLKSMTMFAAAGVVPSDPATGKPIEDFEIVPIIIDPHHANEDLKRTEVLLNSYRKIRRQLYGEQSRSKGFFATKISTLKSLLKESSLNINDSFLFNMSAVERLKFREFIAYNNLNEENQAFLSMLFSPDQLDTNMNIGFVGSPNIGSVALNKFKDSDEFKAFANIFSENDRIFFISSIFGGTGAAGFPIFVKNIRNAQNLEISNKGWLMNSKIGALTVLPYFNIEHSDESPINKTDFIIKTQSALHYYDKALTHQGNSLVNTLYYLGDRAASAPYTNDPGAGGQRNAAHLIEFIGALAPFHFSEISNEDLDNGNVKAFEYGLEEDTSEVSFLALGGDTKKRLYNPLIKLHLLSMFLDSKFKDCIGRGFTNDTPRISKDFLSTDFYRTLTSRFLNFYWDWIEELDGNHRHVTLFNIDEHIHLENILFGINPKKGVFGNKALSHDDVFARMNSISKKTTGNYSPEQLALKLLETFDAATDELIPQKYSKII